MPTLRTRAAGVLLHPTSLPGPHGIGELGYEALRFADSLAAAGQGWWQMLPVGPTGFGNSPYSALSSFAGNPLLIGLADLVRAGLSSGVEPVPWPPGRVPYAEVEPFKERHLRRAFGTFVRRPSVPAREGYEEFLQRTAAWLPDYALYRALKDAYGRRAWTEWDEDVRLRRPEAIARVRRRFEVEIRYRTFVQFEFDRQWSQLRRHCRGLGLGLLGDVPFYVPLDSADVWAHPDLFDLGRRGRPLHVVGVPPDDFSKTGQLWGFPPYRWERHRERGYDWWVRRIRAALERFDAIRIDHFLGFHRAWTVPARLSTALRGRWVPGPGAEILERLIADLGRLDLVAEDLGAVTPEARALRERFDLPGIRVIHFGFGWDPEQYHLPHHYPRRSLACTGTHDNDTSRGWFGAIEHPGTREWVLRYLRTDGREIHWDLVRAVWDSPADVAIAPVQDLLGLGSEARMNVPGVPTGNWEWRLAPGALAPSVLERLRGLTASSGRVPAGARPPCKGYP